MKYSCKQFGDTLVIGNARYIQMNEMNCRVKRTVQPVDKIVFPMLIKFCAMSLEVGYTGLGIVRYEVSR